MKQETREAIHKLCLKSTENKLPTSHLLNWVSESYDNTVMTQRHSQFRVDHANLVTLDDKPLMEVFNFTPRECLRVRNLIREDPTYNSWALNCEAITFFKIPPQTLVPRHIDNEKHEQHAQRRTLFTFNVSSPSSYLQVATDLRSKPSFSVAGYYETFLTPTAIPHSVYSGDETLYLIQIPVIILGEPS